MAGRLPAGWRRPGIAVSAALHAILLVVLALALPSLELSPPPAVESVDVDVLSPEQFAALTSPRATPEQPPPIRELAPALPPAPNGKPLTRADTIISNGTVNAATRKTLRTLAPEARFEQLCDIEAMEQVAAHERTFQPEQAVAYATADARVSGNTLIADGGAFLSKGRWYRLAFRCEATPDRMKVLSFDFAIGGPLDHGVGLGSADAD